MEILEFVSYMLSCISVVKGSFILFSLEFSFGFDVMTTPLGTAKPHSVVSEIPSITAMITI